MGRRKEENIGKERREERIDIKQEYREIFNKSMFYQKMAETSLAYIDRMNPSKEILPNIEDLDENSKKDIRESLNGDMQTWLEMWRNVLEEGKSLPVDLIGMASDIARKDRKRINEQKRAY